VRRLVLMVGLATAGCSSPATPTQPTAAPPPVRFPDLAAMAGTYHLTLDLDPSACSAMPAAARRRVYQVTLEDRGWHFLVVNVAGGGFSEATQIGDLFSGQLNSFHHYDPELRWNGLELNGDVKEPLSDGTELAVAGHGPLARSSALLSGAVKGYAYVSRGSAVVARCEGVHRFWFER
jgi:hypothetical protein